MISGGIMKRYGIVPLFLIITSIVLFTPAAQSEETKTARHWYRLEIQTGDTTYQCMGSSLFDEKEFSKQLAGTDYITLEDVSYVDNTTGLVKRWQEWDPNALPRLYVNPDYVILFTPMKSDPKKSTVPNKKPGK